MNFWALVPMVIIFVLLDSITSAHPVPHNTVVGFGLVMVLVYALVFVFTLRRQTESDIRLAILERALTQAGTDLDELARTYVDDMINTQSTLSRAFLHAWGPYRYRCYIASPTTKEEEARPNENRQSVD